jgi:flagellar protein FliO/FliZ
MEAETYLRFALALVAVLALIAILAVVGRRLGLMATPLFGKPGGRMKVVEAMAIDNRRRLVLVRRDGVEHLLLLGAAGETVVETNIAPPPAPPANVNQPPSGAPKP